MFVDVWKSSNGFSRPTQVRSRSQVWHKLDNILAAKLHSSLTGNISNTATVWSMFDPKIGNILVTRFRGVPNRQYLQDPLQQFSESFNIDTHDYSKQVHERFFVVCSKCRAMFLVFWMSSWTFGALSSKVKRWITDAGNADLIASGWASAEIMM